MTGLDEREYTVVDLVCDLGRRWIPALFIDRSSPAYLKGLGYTLRLDYEDGHHIFAGFYRTHTRARSKARAHFRFWAGDAHPPEVTLVLTSRETWLLHGQAQSCRSSACPTTVL